MQFLKTASSSSSGKVNQLHAAALNCRETFCWRFTYFETQSPDCLFLWLTLFCLFFCNVHLAGGANLSVCTEEQRNSHKATTRECDRVGVLRPIRHLTHCRIDQHFLDNQELVTTWSTVFCLLLFHASPRKTKYIAELDILRIHMIYKKSMFLHSLHICFDLPNV